MTHSVKIHRPTAGRTTAPALALALLAMPVYAHHSSAIYDMEHPVTLEGVVTKYEWANPHVYLYIDTGADGGEPAVWEIEASPPSFMVLRGWSPETFAPGDRVSVEGFAARNSQPMALGGFVETADGARLVMSQNSPSIRLEAGADPLFAALAETVPAAGLSGTWIGLPPDRELVGQFLFRANTWALTDAGAAAFEAFDETTSPAADCVAYTAPFSTVLPDVKILEIGETRATLVTGLDGAERVIDLDAESHDGAAYTNQGHSIGRFEGEALVVDTARFEARPSGNAFALPSSRGKHLVERFELSADRKGLEYTFELSDPALLAEPIRGELHWTHSPGSGLTGGDCNLDNARRYLEGWAD
jgi:Family of unknown function (DUF6152)